MKRKGLALAFILMMLLSFAPVSHASFVEDYQISPLLTPGAYVDYSVTYHPFINSFRVEVVQTISPTLILFNVTLTLFDHSQHSYLQLITVKGAGDDNKVITMAIGNQTISMVPKTDFSIPKYQFFMRLPVISPYLQTNDFVNLDERVAITQGGFGIFVAAFGGDVIDLAFRNTYTYQNSLTGTMLEWDRASGLMLHYTYFSALPSQIDEVDTNIWKTPVGQIYKPISPVVFLLNLYLLAAEVGGLYFTYWELWVASLGAVLIYVFEGWFKKYINDRRRLIASPHLESLLRKVEAQQPRVLFLDDRNRSKVANK